MGDAIGECGLMVWSIHPHSTLAGGGYPHLGPFPLRNGSQRAARRPARATCLIPSTRLSHDMEL
jgi:hypothetical protein